MTKTTMSQAAPATQRPAYRCGFLPVKETTILPRSSIARSGPVPGLLRSGRWSLAVWLLLIAAATPDKAIVNLTWYRKFASRCLGLNDDSTGSSLRGSVARILGRLAELRLITIEPNARHGVALVRLLAVDGSGDPYTMPRRSETKVVHVPTGQLFSNGWHRALGPTELGALLIALTEESWQYNRFGAHQWEKSRDEIARDYGIAASTWSEAKDALLALGLIEWDLPTVRPGSRVDIPPADRYTNHVDVLALDPTTAPRYASAIMPVTVTIGDTGEKLLLHRRGRAEIAGVAASKKVNIIRMPTTR